MGILHLAFANSIRAMQQPQMQPQMPQPQMQPQMMQQQALIGMTPDRQWSSGLCSCLEVPGDCCCGFFCPCILTYQMVRAVAPVTLGPLGCAILPDSALIWALAVWLIGGGLQGWPS